MNATLKRYLGKLLGRAKNIAAEAAQLLLGEQPCDEDGREHHRRVARRPCRRELSRPQITHAVAHRCFQAAE